MERRCCVNNPNSFCYICGSFIVKKQRKNITSFVTKAYKAYFGIELGDQSRPWAPHTVCSVCVEDLRNWTKGKKQSLRFGIPMVWREAQNHSTDCYFCTCNVKGFNAKNKKGIIYPNLPSAMRPVAHGPGIPIPKPPTDSSELISDTASNSDSPSSLVSDEFVPETSNAPQPLSQAKLNDIVRDLNLPKDAAELLGSRLQLGNNKHPDYVKIVNNMLQKFRTLGCNMSLKLHFLFSHLDVFPDNLGAVSEEQGERFHQDIREMERRYQGRWNTSMIADYCWMLCRDSTETHKRKSKRQTFDTKRTRFY